MSFTSALFCLFFPLCVLVVYVSPARWRWLTLLAASLYFYGSWRAWYLVLLLLVTLVTFATGLALERVTRERARLVLGLCITACLGVLFVFKYYNFLALEWNARGGGPAAAILPVLLPVGISFYTFQAIGYAIDVYRGTVRAERHIGLFALFLVFFPQLVAGPIERSTHLLAELRRVFLERTAAFDFDAAASGLRLMLLGLFKKLIVADSLGRLVGPVYQDPAAFSGADALAATYCFAFQIYFDFAGYTDIARGAARVFGVELMENFRQPYLAASVREFWQRWHISLSTWFRDYLYIPLGGNRVAPARGLAAALIVFALSGLWHGAAWTFLVWGLLHGVFYLVGRLKHALLPRARAPRPVRVFLTFHLVLVAWVFFRAATLGDAVLIFRNIATIFTEGFASRGPGAFTGAGFALIALSAILCELIENPGIRARIRPWLRTRALAWSVTLALIAVVIVFGHQNDRQFLYFQF